MELLEPNLKSDSKVLDVGSGSGYLTACFARYIHQKQDATGYVVGIEHHPQLVELGRSNIKADDESLIDTKKVILVGKKIIFLLKLLYCIVHLYFFYGLKVLTFEARFNKYFP